VARQLCELPELLAYVPEPPSGYSIPPYRFCQIPFCRRQISNPVCLLVISF
jgi:hypothetical protein